MLDSGFLQGVEPVAGQGEALGPLADGIGLFDEVQISSEPSLDCRERRLKLLYVAADIPPYVAAQLPEGLLQENVAHARAELGALADEAGADSEVLSGHPPLKMLEYATEIGADLIIIASHRPGLQDYFLGSTAARVVRHAECAVLVDR